MEDEQPNVEIILVEDNPDDSELAVHAIAAATKSFQVHHLKDGVETLNYFFGEESKRKSVTSLRLVVLDLKLPKVDGFEVLKKLRQNEITKAIPVVVLTSSRQKRDIKEAYRLGVNSYVVKPVGFEDFVNKISSIASYWSQINEKPSDA